VVFRNGRNKCLLNFDEINVSILLGGRLVVRKRGCDMWGCRGKGNLSDGKSFFHKTSLLQPLQLSAECYADKSAYEGKTIKFEDLDITRIINKNLKKL